MATFKYEGDAEDTQIDFENDYIALKTNGVQRFIVNSNAITSSVALSCSLGITASHFVGDGSGLTGLSSAAISTYNSAADNRVITSVNSNTVQGEQNLTFDGETLTVTGDLTASVGMVSANITSTGHISGSGVLSIEQIKCSGSVSAVSFVGDGSGLTGLPSAAISSYTNSGNDRIVTSVNSSTVNAEANLTFNGNVLGVTGDISGSGVLSAEQIKCSGSVVAVSFTGDGSGLTGLSSAAIANYNTSGDNRIITSVDSDTVQGEQNLTFDGETLTVTGDLTASVGMVSAHVASSGHISASLGITGSALHVGNFATVIDSNISGSGTLSINDIKCSGSVTAVSFAGDGSNLTNLPSAAITTYNTSGDNRIITSVNSTTVQGESALTFDGETLAITGDLTASVGLSTPHVGSTGHITASLGITGSAIHAGNFTTVINSTHVSSSLAISASSFWANGVQLTSGGGGGSPGGSDGQVQYNNGGSFGGESNFVYDDGNDRVGIGTSAPSHTLSVTGSAQVTGNLTVSGSLRSTGTIHVTHHCFANTGTAAMMVPFITETETTSGDRRHQMIAPFPGRLLKVWLRTKTNINGNCTVTLKKATDGTEDFAAGGTDVEAVTVSMTAANTSFEFPMTGSNQYSAGEIVGVEVNPTSNGSDYNVTCIWEYNNSVI